MQICFFTDEIFDYNFIVIELDVRDRVEYFVEEASD
jgi:hypothetical protein